jgi:hypothetical protein
MLMLLVENGNQAEKSNTNHSSHEGSKERIPGEGPAEEEGAEVKQEEH